MRGFEAAAHRHQRSADTQAAGRGHRADHAVCMRRRGEKEGPRCELHIEGIGGSNLTKSFVRRRFGEPGNILVGNLLRTKAFVNCSEIPRVASNDKAECNGRRASTPARHRAFALLL